MIILLGFAFVSGVLTILAPCIWPLLPIILSSSATGRRGKPLGIVLGILISFSFFTLSLSYILKLFPFDPNILRLVAVVIIGFFGLTLIVPALSQIVEGLVSRLSGKLTPGGKNQGSGFFGGLITGLSLGLVWSPCAGPILGTIAALSATQSVNFSVIILTLVYVSGVGTPLFIFTSFGQRIFSRSRILNKHTGQIQQVFGAIMILTALAIFTNFDKTIQIKLLNLFPSYSNFITKFESGQKIKNQLDALKGQINNLSGDLSLNNLGPAPDLNGISHWLNTDKPLSITDLKGKVILVDFWTYTCINCIRTLPHVTAWYDKYKDRGFVVIGVHTPEFAFEKDTKNVSSAIKQFNIHYPVAQDNDYATWNNFNNQYWPAEYLIDARGILRRTHFGEGEYDQTEMAIQALLKEAGKQATMPLENLSDQTPTGRLSPETYLGAKRMEFYYFGGSLGNGKQTFKLADSPSLNSFSFGGDWNITAETAIAGNNSVLNYHFTAGRVYIILRPGENPVTGGGKVKVFLDGKLIDKNNGGADVINGIVTVDRDRLYNIIDLHGKIEDHILKLEFETSGTEVYTFTFG